MCFWQPYHHRFHTLVLIISHFSKHAEILGTLYKYEKNATSLTKKSTHEMLVYKEFLGSHPHYVTRMFHQLRFSAQMASVTIQYVTHMSRTTYLYGLVRHESDIYLPSQYEPQYLTATNDTWLLRQFRWQGSDTTKKMFAYHSRLWILHVDLVCNQRHRFSDPLVYVRKARRLVPLDWPLHLYHTCFCRTPFFQWVLIIIIRFLAWRMTRSQWFSGQRCKRSHWCSRSNCNLPWGVSRQRRVINLWD